MCTHFRSYLQGALITVHSDGSRTVMECWPDGICCLASFHLCLNTAHELSTLMLMAFLVNAANVHCRAVRCPRRRGRPEAPVQRRHSWINCLPLLPWGIRWMLIFCLNYLVQHGSLPLILRRSLLIWNRPVWSWISCRTASRLDNTLITVCG